ncbi:tripartite tricarboxylate transporter substrate binding protein [Falsiroseomonas sp.]|uniref:tripartite tricarboxylate transporter substrate binding protein n=1 Tax=Falsiroseomonas sp. TaxID=2870721 RepID=UPI003F6EF84D
MHVTRRAALVAPLVLATPRLALAAWPERPVTLIVPFAAGGGTDISARVMAQYLERDLGQPFVVQNRPGAGGAIGLGALAAATPDGYTLAIINTPGIVTIPIERNAGWTMDSFTFIAGVVDDPGTFSIHPDSPIRTMTDLVEAAKREPRRVTVATQGVGSAGHINTLLLEQATGAQLEPVVYQGAAPAALALLRKEATVATANLGEALTFARNQPWRTLGVMAESRNAMAPDVPTLREMGMDILGGSLRGVGGPRGMAPDVVARLSAAIARVVANPEFVNTSERAFQPLRYLNAADYVAYLRASDATHRALWRTRPWNV